jgi:fumarate reductase subunit C
MRIVFLVSFLLGLVLGVISMLAGIDRNQSGARWVSFVNLPTIGAGFALFGISGYLLHRYSTLGTAALLSTAVAIAVAGTAGTVALIAGWAVPSAAREVQDERYALQGLVGRVTRSIARAGEGEISYMLDGRRRTVTARSLNGDAIAQDADIVIERIENDVAYVELWSTIARQLELPS